MKLFLYQFRSEKFNEYEYAIRWSTTPLEHTEHRTVPLWTVCPINCPVLLQCPNEFIPNTKVVRNISNTPDTQPTRVSDVHDTSGMIPPPPDTLVRYSPEVGTLSPDELSLRATCTVQR